jgi:hypothetical protein
MTGVEATGDLVTGALIAGAVERRSGERSPSDAPQGLCLNCGTALLGDYCHRCGQAEHIHRSLPAIWHDLAHGVLHFEGKIWNTLPLLAWRPGELTRRFVHGERARFVSPMALFLFSVFLMFALFSAIGAHMEVPEDKPPNEMAQSAAQSAIPRVEAEIRDLRRQRSAAKPAERKEIGDRLNAANTQLDRLNEVARWKPGRNMDLRSGWPWLDQGLKKANENPNLILYKLQSSAYKFSWALIPLSVPFLWLLYAWRPKYKVYDHAVFVTYSLAFMSMLVIVLTLLSEVGVSSAVIALSAMAIPPLHIYRQLRGAYGTRRLPALLRTCALVLFAGVTLFAFLMLLLTVGVLG